MRNTGTVVFWPSTIVGTNVKIGGGGARTVGWPLKMIVWPIVAVVVAVPDGPGIRKIGMLVVWPSTVVGMKVKIGVGVGSTAGGLVTGPG
jgi:hypothetical protein